MDENFAKTLRDGTDKTDKTSLSSLLEAARVVTAATSERYETELAAEMEAKSYAAANKSGMADGYWKHTHEAKLRMHAARALLDALETEV